MLEGKKINELPSISTISDETVVPAVYVNNGSANLEASKVSIDQIKAHINEDNYTKNQVDILLNTKQDKLTDGAGIEIDSDEISIDDTVLTKTKLVAGSNVTIAEDSDENLVISSTCGNDGANKDLSNLTDAGKIQVANLASPSNQWIDLVLAASDSVYTAPADGYVALWANATGLQAANIQLLDDNDETMVVVQCTGNTDYLLTPVSPVRKGQKFKVWYNFPTSALQYFRFIYAKGSESEYTPAE